MMKTKILLILGALLIILFFSSDFALIDIEKTAIIVGIGIDKVDDEYEITAQIAIPQATDTAASNNDAVISSKDKTVMEAIDGLGDTTGWYPKMSFCNLIVFGKDVASEDITHIINHLLASEKIQNSALLALSDTTAKEVLHATTPLDAISSFAIQKIIMKNLGAVSPVADVNVKDFAVFSHCRSKTGFMPLIKIVKGDNKGKEGASSAETASYKEKNEPDFFLKSLNNRPIAQDLFAILSSKSGGGEGSGGGKGEDANVVFDGTSTAIFSKGVHVDTLSKDETLAYNLFNERPEEILIDTKVGDKRVSLEVYGSTHNVRLEFKEKPILKISLNLKVRLADSNEGDNSLNALGRRAKVPDEYCKALEEKLVKTIEDFSNRLLQKDADLMLVREMIYKYHNKDYEDLKKIPLSSYITKAEIKVKSKD